MGGTFACPECGNELQLKGTSPGRQVRCGWCETWVEVPFLPRSAGPTRRRRFRGQRPKWVTRAWAGLAVVGILIFAIGVGQVFRSRDRARRERAVAVLVATADDDERAGRLDEALASLDAAIRQTGRLVPPQPARVAELRGRRDRLSRRLVEAQLEAAGRAGTGQAIATYKALLARAWREPALAGLEGTIRERLERTRRRSAESDAAEARQALAEGEPNKAIDACERVVAIVDELDHETRGRLLKEADALVTSLVEARGVIFEPVEGQFARFGSTKSYNAFLHPELEKVFRDHGYVPRRPSSYWAAAWEARAPYRVKVKVVERLEGSYAHTGNRLSYLDITTTLLRSGTSIWQFGPLTCHTRPSIPTLAAFTARSELDGRQTEAFERLLYDDARAVLLQRLTTQLQSLPAPGP